MKKHLLITTALLLSLSLTSCFSNTEVKSSSPERQSEDMANTTVNTMQNEDTTKTAEPAVSRSWEYRFDVTDEAEIKNFDEAGKIADASNSTPQVFSDTSEHFGEWYVIRYEKEARKGVQATDQMPKPRTVSVVNISKKKVITKIDDAAPIFIESVLSIEDFSDVSPKLIRRMASAACAVTHGHDSFDVYPGPTLDKEGDAAVLTFDVVPRYPGGPVEHCVMKIYQDKIEWNSNEQF